VALTHSSQKQQQVFMVRRVAWKKCCTLVIAIENHILGQKGKIKGFTALHMAFRECLIITATWKTIGKADDSKRKTNL